MAQLLVDFARDTLESAWGSLTGKAVGDAVTELNTLNRRIVNIHYLKWSMLSIGSVATVGLAVKFGTSSTGIAVTSSSSVFTLAGFLFCRRKIHMLELACASQYLTILFEVSKSVATGLLISKLGKDLYDAHKKEACQEEGLVEEVGLLSMLLSPMFGVPFKVVTRTISSFVLVHGMATRYLLNGNLFRAMQTYWINSHYNGGWFGKFFRLPMAGYDQYISGTWSSFLANICVFITSGIFFESMVNHKSVKKRTPFVPKDKKQEERATEEDVIPSGVAVEARKKKRSGKKVRLTGKDISNWYEGDLEVFSSDKDKFYRLSVSEFKAGLANDEFGDDFDINFYGEDTMYHYDNTPDDAIHNESLLGKSQLQHGALKMCVVEGSSLGSGLSTPKGVIVMRHFLDAEDKTFKLKHGKTEKIFNVSDLDKTSNDELLLLPRNVVGSFIGVTKLKGGYPRHAKPASGVLAGINTRTGKDFVASGTIGDCKHNMASESGCCGSVLVSLEGTSPVMQGIHHLSADQHGLNGFIPFTDTLVSDFGLN